MLIQNEIDKTEKKNGFNRIYRYLKDNEFLDKDNSQVLKELENERTLGGSVDYSDKKEDGNNVSLEV